MPERDRATQKAQLTSGVQSCCMGIWVCSTAERLAFSADFESRCRSGIFPHLAVGKVQLQALQTLSDIADNMQCKRPKLLCTTTCLKRWALWQGLCDHNWALSFIRNTAQLPSVRLTKWTPAILCCLRNLWISLSVWFFSFRFWIRSRLSGREFLHLGNPSLIQH